MLVSAQCTVAAKFLLAGNQLLIKLIKMHNLFTGYFILSLLFLSFYLLTEDQQALGVNKLYLDNCYEWKSDPLTLHYFSS